ncbi:MAG: ferritin family protein [Tepidanaerobacter acetatoxydans]|uniref:ferritin family protein n=1 Tax=Tepidanaerobacter acetatoxydans TaxID=499229 RepID=UPI0026EDCE14|nr:ferritin family protein [Tepidanaerobacter acetatoxydans]NLU10267.1 ferritin family protein [Tepidanaerobacter acetatoxydans]
MEDFLKTALKFEENGYQFYTKISEEIKQPLAKRLFESLAIQEKDHAERIKEIYNNMQDGSNVEPTARPKYSLEPEVKKIFYELDKEKKKIPLDNIEGYKLAMEMEKKGYNMYKEFTEKSKDKREKEFFRLLMEEEKEHLTSLDNVYRFLTGTEDWYAEEESKVWNWMNT